MPGTSGQHRRREWSISAGLYNAPYNSIDFNSILTFFKENYAYVDTNDGLPIALGTSYYVGSDSVNAIKVDVYYTDAFIRPLHQNGLVRLAHQEDIIAMKLEIIGRSGRKKDFWDIHALHSKYDLNTMIQIYKERYPYNHSESEIRNGFTNFSLADEDFDPICLKVNHWELVKLDIVNWASDSK